MHRDASTNSTWRTVLEYHTVIGREANTKFPVATRRLVGLLLLFTRKCVGKKSQKKKNKKIHFTRRFLRTESEI